MNEDRIAKRETVIKSRHAILSELNKKPFRNRKTISAMKKEIEALDEAQRGDILNPSVAASIQSGGNIRGNNYTSYSSQVTATYNMYNAESEYGAATLRGIVDTRVAFIGGEGISFTAEKKESLEYIEKFIKGNELDGSLLLDMITTGEMEGKNLAILLKDTAEELIKVREFSWYINNYTVNVDKNDNRKITGFKVKKKTSDAKDITIPVDKSVYVRLGGSPDKINETTNRIHTALTQVENYDRALYDLRANNHLFAKITPFFKTDNQQAAKSINNAISAGDWTPGRGYAGSAEFSMVGPPTGALEAIKGEMLLNLKMIASVVGIPVHWMSWPELMSNRATAENLLEVVSAATKKARLVWEEAIYKLIRRSMDMAVAAGFEKPSIVSDDFTIKLPLISLANLKQLIETWFPLYQDGVISMATLRNNVPGIDPEEERRKLQEEAEERAKNAPLPNRTFREMMDNQDGDQEDQDANSDKNGE